MSLRRAIVQATAAEAALASAALSVAGAAAGPWSEWADVLNAGAPAWLGLGVLAAILAATGFDSGRARSVILGLAALGVGACLLRVAPEHIGSIAQPRNDPAAAGSFKLLTVNVWRENRSTGRAVSDIVSAAADVVSLQEPHGLEPSHWRALSAVYPYRASCDRGRTFSAVLLSRRPFALSGCAIARTDAEGALGYAWGRTSAPDGRPVDLISTHFTWPLPPGRQPAQSRALALALRGAQVGDLVVAGDFNTTPWSYAMVRQDRAFAPLIRRTLALPTWPARLPRLDSGWPVPVLPIDHVYAGPQWRTLDVRRLGVTGSDHYGVLVTLAR